MENQITIEGMKGQAKALRGYLSDQGIDLSHSKSLEAVARSHSFKDWNTASALVLKMEKFWEEEYERLKTHEEWEGSDKKVYQGLYASKQMLVYCGWQQMGTSVKVAGHSSAVLTIIPVMSAYFEPKAVRLIGSEISKPSVNRRFVVGAVEVGKSPQLAVNYVRPRSFEEGLISDVFSRSHDPLLVNWAVFSTVGLARELEIHVYNLNEQEILVSSCLWGNAVTSLHEYS